MQFLLLGLLLDGSATLYDLHKRFRAGISLFYAASFGSIQRALRQVEEQGWARSEESMYGARRKRFYGITDEGRTVWRSWMLSALTGSDPEPVILARIYLLGHLAEAERAACIAVIRSRLVEDEQRLRALANELDAVTISDEVADHYRYRRATLDYGLRSHDLALAWLADVELAP